MESHSRPKGREGGSKVTQSYFLFAGVQQQQQTGGSRLHTPQKFVRTNLRMEGQTIGLWVLPTLDYHWVVIAWARQDPFLVGLSLVVLAARCWLVVVWDHSPWVSGPP